MTDALHHEPLIEIESPTAEPAAAKIGKAVAGKATHAHQLHLDGLIHAGVVTHLIHVDEVPDPLYALSQMKDLPEVSFAAAFNDGLIALGCPGALPDALAKIASPATAAKMSNQQTEQFADLSVHLSAQADVVTRLEKSIAQLTKQSAASATRQSETADALQRMFAERLAKETARLEQRIDEIPSDPAASMNDFREMLARLIDQVDSGDGPPISNAPVLEKIDQLAATQRTALARVEAAVNNAVSGLEPALNHLNARTADTENTLASWFKELHSLSQTTQTIAEQSAQVTPALTALQSNIASLAQKPTPEPDLSEQREAFASLNAALNSALSEMKALGRKSDEKAGQAVARAEQAMATLQSLPNLISATLRRDVDLAPLGHALATVQNQLDALPERLQISEIRSGLATLNDETRPLTTAQKAALDELRTQAISALTKLGTVEEDLTKLPSQMPDLAPLVSSLAALRTNHTEAMQSSDDQMELVRDILSRLAHHLGVATPQAHVLPAPHLVPDTSLNSLRMEFADLISKRIKENRTPLPPEARQA